MCGQQNDKLIDGDWNKVSVAYKTDKGLIFKVYKELVKINKEKLSHLIEKCPRNGRAIHRWEQQIQGEALDLRENHGNNEMPLDWHLLELQQMESGVTSCLREGVWKCKPSRTAEIK